jgi:hypothetical protein
MARVIDLECNLPIGVDDPVYKESTQSRPGNPIADRLPRPEGYGFANYQRIFKGRAEMESAPVTEDADKLVAGLVADMDKAGIEVGILASARRSERARARRESLPRALPSGAIS